MTDHISYAERFDRLEQFLTEELRDQRQNSQALLQIMYNFLAFMDVTDEQKKVLLDPTKEFSVKDPNETKARLEHALQREVEDE